MQNSREKLADFAALCTWIMTSIVMAVFTFFEHGQDFRGYYAAARVLLEGGNPYDYARVAQVLLDVTGRAGNNPFFYPLWFGWFVAPLSLLPFQLARAIWMLFNWASWLVGLIRLQQLLGFPRKGWRTWLLNLLATFIFAWTTWKFEQTGILLFVIMVEILIAYQHKKWNRMGFFLALALIKPNVMLLPISALGAWLIRNKNWIPVIVAVSFLAGLLMITTLLTPDWHQPFFQPNFGQGLTEVLDGPNQVTGTRLNTTLPDWLKWFAVPEGLRNLIYAIAVPAGMAIIIVNIWRSKSILDVASISLLVSFGITPYALQYDFPPLTIVLFWALSLSGYSRSKLIPNLLILFITSVLIWERPISDGYWIVIGLSILTVWLGKTALDKQITPKLS
ncbi:MAG: glycosyltransferase family 87 protein [Chloroflexota bacterium]